MSLSMPVSHNILLVLLHQFAVVAIGGQQLVHQFIAGIHQQKIKLNSTHQQRRIKVKMLRMITLISSCHVQVHS